jgi:hypothetical protein
MGNCCEKIEQKDKDFNLDKIFSLGKLGENDNINRLIIHYDSI